MSRWIVVCMLAALICGNQTNSEVDDDIVRLLQSNSKHATVQKGKTFTLKKPVTTEKPNKIVKHINATDNKLLDAHHHSIIDPKFKSTVQNPHKVNERRFGKRRTSSNPDRRIKFKRAEIKSLKTTASNTVRGKSAEIVPDLSLPDDKKENSGIESIEESDSEFHTANRLFLLQMEKEEQQSDSSPISAMEGRKYNRHFKIEAGGGFSLNDKANNKPNKPNRTKLVQIKKLYRHDRYLKLQNELKFTTKKVPPIRKQNTLRKNSNKSSKTSPAATNKQDEKLKTDLNLKSRTNLTPILKQSSFKKTETGETRNGSTKIDYVSVSDDDDISEKDEEKTNETVSDDMSDKYNEQTNEKIGIAETRNSSVETDNESISGKDDDLSEKYDEETNEKTEKVARNDMSKKHDKERTNHSVKGTEEVFFFNSTVVKGVQLNSTEIMTRSRSFRSCFNKKTLKLCIKSCHNAFVDACKRLECARDPKLELRKQCKKSCKSIFRH